MLSDYMGRTGLPATKLAEVMGKPRSTVQKWLNRVHCPPRKDVPHLCAKLGWNYKALFRNASSEDVFFEKQVIGFEILQQRYLSLKLKDPFAALSLLVQAGALGFVYLLKAGIEGRLNVEPNFAVYMMIMKPGLTELMVRFEARGFMGLGFYVMDVRGNVLTEWKTLINTHLDMAINVLNNSLRKS